MATSVITEAPREDERIAVVLRGANTDPSDLSQRTVTEMPGGRPVAV